MCELLTRPSFSPLLIHTGQHFSQEMSDSFFRELEIPQPDVNLEVGSGSHAAQTAQIMLRLEPVFLESPPALVLVAGDVNSTVAAALVAAKLRIPIAHVEAGLRSFDRTMPEEINRLVTDALSDFLFVTEPSGETNLRAEGVPAEKIFFVGNVMIDTLLRFREKAACSTVLEQFKLQPQSYAVVTLHRPSNVDDPQGLRDLFAMLSSLAREIPVIFPVHPRTRARMESSNISAGSVILTGPLGYLDFLRLLADARLVLTDSGGIQEETTVLQVPCLTLRDNTERPITISQGTNRLVGSNPANALKAALETLHAPPRSCTPPKFWDGRASARIADILQTSLAGKSE
jgi:UDP-N-acetylglucosamine 2-epimerase (non-hydrolysing)